MQRVWSCPRVLWCLIILLPLAGCSKPAAPPAAPQDESFKKATIGVSLASLSGPWRAQMKADLEAAAAKHPDIRLLIYDAQNDAARQQAQIEEFVNSHVRAMIVSPVDAQALTEPAAKAFDAGIPVVVLDRALIGDKCSCFIAADWERIGAEAGKWLAHRLHGKGKIVELKGPVDSLPAQQLHEAFRAALREPGYHFVFDACLDPPRADAAKLMGETLGRVHQFDAVFACDDAAARAAYEAAKAAGREACAVYWRRRSARGGRGLREKGHPQRLDILSDRRRRSG